MSGTGQHPERGPGLQPERTALAWQRTGLAAAGLCLLLAFTAIRLGAPPVAISSAALSIVTLIVALRSFHRGREAWPRLTRIVLVVIAIAVLGMLLTLERLVTPA